MRASITNIRTGEITDEAIGIDATTARAMRECDAEITRLDLQIEDIKDELKARRAARTSVVEHLRSYARGSQSLPFDDDGRDK